MLKVKKLVEHAKLPTVAHPGEDLGFDLYAAESVLIRPGQRVVIGTGIAAQFFHDGWQFGQCARYGLLIRDRGSMANRGLMVSAGVVDASYTGEIKVILTNTETIGGYWNPTRDVGMGGEVIKAGDKIAQMIPIPVLTSAPVQEVDELEGSRGDRWNGSSGK